MPSKESQSKTSKTARVMNLLSKKPDPSVGEAADSAAPVPPIISSLAPDAEVSVQIKNALEDELAAGSAPAARQSARTEPVKQPEPVSQPEQASQPEPTSQPETASQPAAPAAEPAEPAAPAESTPAGENAPRFAEPVDPGYINVMQVLVEEKAPKYIKMSGVCTCKRCLEDIKALTLNHLPPKYVVVADGDRIPRLTVYEGRYSSDITAQLLHACEAVKLRPHHGR